MRSLLVLLAVMAAGCSSATPPKPSSAASPASTSGSRALIAAGDRLPAISAPRLDAGGQVSAVPGKVNVLFFWATWSEPDKRAMPKLQGIHERHATRGLAVTAISVDDERERVLEAARAWGATFPIGWDERHSATGAIGLSCEPAFYVVDAGGTVRFVHCGYHDGLAEEIEKEVVALLPPTRAAGAAARAPSSP